MEDKTPNWAEETEKITNFLLECGLTQEIKWGAPCFTFQGANIVAIQGFKNYFALLFFKGVLLSDPHNILIKTGPFTEFGRQLRFNNVQEMEIMEQKIKACIYEAIEIERQGLGGNLTSELELPYPEELESKFNEMPALRTAFEALTPGRKKSHLIHFLSAKQSKTRTARIEQSIPKIMDGKGMNDDYMAKGKQNKSKPEED